ncbi:uncharacterized protein LOC109705243 isoform X2 [Ananas comosus]|uniref:Uncharacterized protein LOC109705243 isoform X2 n=1 Tax=Ananas comosus TaxID=4615 RepID=A0A6P5EDZ1_ANACO|nr:uncharacterized protein LOC109705243 isoform X2 [Ananas comosus]
MEHSKTVSQFQLCDGSYSAETQKKKPTYKHHCQLKEAEISGFTNECNEVELAIYLLNNAIARERLIINSKGRMYLGGGKWSYKSIHLSDYPSWKQAQDIILQQKVNPRVELIFL